MKHEGRDWSSDAERNNSAATVCLDRVIQDRIGNHLRAMYDGLVQQPVPDRFRELIERLDETSPRDLT